VKGGQVDPFPSDIKSFMDQNIDCTEQLEMLRILSEAPEKQWSTASLAAEVQAAPAAMSAYLRALQARGLIAGAAAEGDVLWRHGASTPELQQVVERLLQAYKERPVSMIRMVYARRKTTLEEFADAFRIRKES
jgi:hypothetical protein